MTSSKNISEYAEFLKSRLCRNLPGAATQDLMAPSNRRQLIETAGNKHRPKPSSVMIVLYPDKTGQMATVFIKRVDYEGVHSGQIAFPGGKYEPGDRDLLQTAIRETREEIGLEIGEHEVVGKLTDLYVPPSNFMISPYVAVLKNLPELYPDKTEVAEIFSAPVLQFLGDGSMTFQKYRFANGQEIDVPGFNFGRHFIWGATAMIFREMIQIIKEVNQQE